MRYVVRVQYTLQRDLIIHAANEKIAGEKAYRIVEGWHDASSPQIILSKEALE